MLRILSGFDSKLFKAPSRCVSSASSVSNARLWKNLSRRSSHMCSCGLRRQKYHAHIFGQLDLLVSMPTRPINHHDYIFVPIARRDLVRKQLHAMPVNLRQNQRIKPPIYRADRAIGVGVLLRHHGANHWPVRLLIPAMADIADPAKTRFVLKHQPERTRYGKSCYFRCQPLGEFFSIRLAQPGQLQGVFYPAQACASRAGTTSDTAWTAQSACTAWLLPEASREGQ